MVDKEDTGQKRAERERERERGRESGGGRQKDPQNNCSPLGRDEGLTRLVPGRPNSTYFCDPNGMSQRLMLAPWHLSIPRCHPSMAFSFLSALRVLSPSRSRPRFFIAPNRALSTANGVPLWRPGKGGNHCFVVDFEDRSGDNTEFLIPRFLQVQVLSRCVDTQRG